MATFNAEKEITRMWRGLHSAQDEIGKTYYRWRQAALEAAGADADPLKVGLRAAEIMGEEIGRSMLPRLNWLKGEEAWLLAVGKQIAANWSKQGAIVELEKGKDGSELLIKWTRCPWPTHAKNYDVSMEEDVLCCDKILQTLLQDVTLFFNVDYKIETLKAIPRGQGCCVRRLYKVS